MKNEDSGQTSSSEVMSLATPSTATRGFTALERGLLAAVKSQRFMLYAWKAARANFGLGDDHGELNRSIAETEAVISKAEAQS